MLREALPLVDLSETLSFFDIKLSKRWPIIRDKLTQSATSHRVDRIGNDLIEIIPLKDETYSPYSS